MKSNSEVFLFFDEACYETLIEAFHSGKPIENIEEEIDSIIFAFSKNIKTKKEETFFGPLDSALRLRANTILGKLSYLAFDGGIQPLH